jgi:hypothetical protein
MVPTDALPAAEFLIRHLYRSIDVAQGKKFFAITESETPGGDDWYGNDDNAKSLELLSRAEALDHPYFISIGADTQPAGDLLFSVGKPGRGRIDMAGASYYSIRQGFISGDAFAIHTVPRGPAPLATIETEVRPAGKLRRAIATYAFPGPQRGGRLVAVEWKLITSGGFYNRVSDYLGFVRDAGATRSAQLAAFDFSISYDYGVTINAFAKCFAVCASGDVTPKATTLQNELRSLFDLYLDYYFDLYVNEHGRQPNAIFSRELAFVILGVVTMYRATGAADYSSRLGRLCDVLLDFEVRFEDVAGNPASGFLMRLDSPRAAYVDCHSAVLLALTQASRYVSDPRLAAAIDRGLAGYFLETCRVDVGGPHKVDTVSTTMIDDHGICQTENPFWNFKVGITLRFFNALRNATDPALQAVAALHRDRIELFEMILRRQLERSISARDDGIEIRIPEVAAETNSETQPWVMTGLLGHPYD